MTIDSPFPVPLSMAETVKIPLAKNCGRVSETLPSDHDDDGHQLTIDLKGNLDLGLSSGSRRNVGQVEFTELVVVLGHGSFTFVDLDGYGRLVVHGGREDLRFLGRNNGVSGAVKDETWTD
jgi:hypothetical protein